MIDIHCHILPGIDDGPRLSEESIRMIEMAANDGITHIVATPHFSTGTGLTSGDINRACDGFKNLISGKGNSIKLLEGADIKLTYELIAALEKGEIPTINKSRYFLLELPEILPPNLDNLFFTAEINGFIPIITHPERNYTLLSSPEKVDGIRSAGSLFQITAMSITGEFGGQIQMFSRQLFRRGLVDFVATDAHDSIRRKPLLSRAYKEVIRLCGEKLASKIFRKNPEAVLENREIGSH